ncbi:ras GTPase-activating protein raskol isoform X5 [Vanessa atalanta]|uniref:ras GTPase-activating protein raskol isoform X5 n=1 Tax=Vanessa atalanta TaxID=42275 RepID=UPI001FCDB849|nr:ras GTPase-activating protein raskol isoform X5 [Vanessa atalanta]
MPDWRYNVLSTSEAYIDAEGGPPRDPFAASYPRRADRSRPPHTCPYTTIFLGTRTHVPYRLTPLQSENGDLYADAYSVDRSSNLTDTSSFARYEDCRSQLESTLIPKRDNAYSNDKTEGSVTLQVQKVPYTSGVFYVAAKTDSVNDVPGNSLFPCEASDSDALSSCTCDSFERCEFDCRDFEPFSDTCCCDPLSDGVCSRSPKEVDSPEHFCDRVVEEDRVSARSDMDGLDLTLFEPAQTDSNDCGDESTDQNSASATAALCGILYALPIAENDVATSAVSGAVVGVPPSWEPFYCVLQQDRRTLTAYTSEELASFPGFYLDYKTSNNNGEYATRSLPRVRIDGGSNVGNGVRLRCWAAPPSITEEEVEDEIEDDAVSLRALPSQDTSYEKACRRGSAPSTPVPGAQAQHSPSRLASFFFSKRSFRSNPLKRTKSATKLERERALAAVPTHPATHALRTSRSHESLLSAHSPAVSTMDLGPPNQVEIRALHSSVLGRPHCFALSAENRAPRYFACASRKERDRWIYSLRQAARPDEIRTRRCERTVKLWLLEAKAIPPKKRYYCEILLDDTLYARSSSKLKTELCFWGEVYEFSALPAVRAIHVNVYREPERRARKRDCFATFRERLSSMGREDISDNLISASIFLRFLCPAILSPSLFGITHEYPNERAARNLTLVAKTLQTLANFTRFQGKEAFMEFLNDFLEQEAPNMKAFLRSISTRPQEQQQSQSQLQQQQDGSQRNSSASQGSITGSEGSRSEVAVDADPEWAPHVDLGKQLATLHGLLADSLPKLPAGKIQELDPLSEILEDLNKRLMSNDNGPAPVGDNIFRFNDPTCNTPTKQNVDVPTNGPLNNNFAHSSPIMNKNGVQFNISPSKSNAEESKYKGSYVTVSKSPSFNLRSATLPRNGYGSSPVNQNVNPDRYSSQYNNQEHCVNLKVVQIGFGSDQYPKGISNGINESLERRFQERYKPNSFNQQTHYHNSNYNSTERSPSSDSINHNYSANEMQNIMKETATLDELSDLLKYADDSDIVDEKIMNKKNMSQSKSNNNNIINGNKNSYTNNGSNVSISGLSNVASSGYQSIATYSQSSSPIENTTHLHQPYENGGQPMSRYSQLNYQKQRDKQYYDNKNEKFYPKSPVQQKIEYDIQKYGIQNFTTADNVQSNTNANTKIAPLVFTNPVYNMEDNRQSQEIKKTNENRNSKRCPCGSSSSSIDEEGLSTDNVETNSEEGSTNFNDDGRNFDQQNRNNTHRKLTRDNCNYEDLYQRSNQSHSPRIREDESSSNSPSLRKSSKTRMPRTNPMLSYSTNQNQLNLKHFGQRGESLYESKPHHISTDSGYPMSRSESNVEEVNKEMYRLQISRSQKALFNMENSKNSPEKFLTESSIPETNYPLDRTYSGAKVSSSRLNEDLERHQDYYGVRERRESPSKMFNRESHSSEASERAPVRTERDLPARDKLQRRLSLESARELTDSSDEVDETLYSTTGRRRTKHHRTIEQYEREIERLKCSVEMLRGRLGPTDSGQDHTDAKMKAIISRLICVEEELRREQRKMAAALSHKQRVIEAQEHRIAALDEANTRLLSALVHLQQRAPHPAPAHNTNHNNSHSPHSQHSHQELQI